MFFGHIVRFLGLFVFFVVFDWVALIVYVQDGEWLRLVLVLEVACEVANQKLDEALGVVHE